MPPVTSVPELRNLSNQDIDFVDEVIRRAGPNASSFCPIFTAYSAVLKERNMDPQESLYYGKLLKLGTLKGENWGEKWERVKAQFAKPILAQEKGSAFVADSKPRNARESLKDIQNHLHSNVEPSLAGPETPPPRFPAKRMKVSQSKDRLLEQRFPPSLPTIPSVTSKDDNPSPVPPSYKSSHIDDRIPDLLKQPTATTARKRLPQISAIAQHALGKPNKPKKSANLDLDEVWKNIDMENNEKYADEFFHAKLLRRYWNIWKQGSIWVTETQLQVSTARDKILLHKYLDRWHLQLKRRHVEEDRLVQQFNQKLIKTTFVAWQSKLKQRRTIVWRNEMRERMKIIRSQIDSKLKQDVWTKWRYLQLGRRADRHYIYSLFRRSFVQWKTRLVQLETSKAVADDFSIQSQGVLLRKFWSVWKTRQSSRWDEFSIAHKVNQRIMADAFDLWRKRHAQNLLAQLFSEKRVKKAAILHWHGQLTNLEDLNTKATQHLISRDITLLRGFLHRWRISMRGKRLEKYKVVQLQQRICDTWRRRLINQNAQVEKALAFQSGCSSSLVIASLAHWKQVLQTHRNASAFADQRYIQQLQAKTMLTWRLRLRESYQTMKIARWANRFFTTRAAWRTWAEKMADRAREKRLQLWEKERTKKFLLVWHKRTQEARRVKLVQDQTNQKLVQSALTQWMKRVIELKSRELDVGQQYDAIIQAAAFQRWKARRQRNLELQKLLESQLLVRDEVTKRQMFRRWLNITRSIGHRREAYERKEQQIKRLIKASAWDRWRQRFKEERLRPVEYEVIIRQQRGIMLRALSVWRQKTLSLPAIHFYTHHLKEKHLRLWKDALPYAKQLSKARQVDRHSVQRTYLNKWREAYQTKTTMKFVERAKNLRLPAIRQPRSLAPRPLSLVSRNRFTRVEAETTDEDSTSVDDLVKPTASRPLALGSRPVTRPSRLRTTDIGEDKDIRLQRQSRQSSPVRSVASYAGRRRSKSPASTCVPSVVSEGDRLWSALKGIGSRRL